MSNLLNCATPNCPNEAKFKCPTCIKLDIKMNCNFCSQECFKFFWTVHKLIHNKPEAKDQPSEVFKNYKFSGPLRPGYVSPMVQVLNHILKPDYAISSVPKSEIEHNKHNKIPKITDPTDLANLKEAALISRQALDLGHKSLKVGITTDEINNIVHDFIVSKEAYPSPLNYHGFPKSICTSVNEVICHGIPDSRPLQNGDIVNLDITVYYKGFHSDLNETFVVGEASEKAKRLIEASYRSLEEAIKICKPGVMYKKVGKSISEVISKAGFSIVRSYCGHGIGKLFHCAPNVSHYDNNKDVGIMEPGHVFTIEPMINAGDWRDATWPDGWTAVTRDGELSAQFEHTILITEDGAEVLTKRLPDSPPLHFETHN